MSSSAMEVAVPTASDTAPTTASTAAEPAPEEDPSLQRIDTTSHVGVPLSTLVGLVGRAEIAESDNDAYKVGADDDGNG